MLGTQTCSGDREVFPNIGADNTLLDNTLQSKQRRVVEFGASVKPIIVHLL